MEHEITLPCLDTFSLANAAGNWKSPPQAGEELICVCGRKVAAPTLRGLRALEQVAEAPATRQAWGARKGAGFLGATTIILSLGLVLGIQIFGPKPPNPADYGTPPPNGVGPWHATVQQVIRYHDDTAHFQNWHTIQTISFVFAGCGLLLVLAAILNPARAAENRASPPPAAK